MVQREDACFQSRRWLFDSVHTHRRHTQAVNGARSRPVCAQAFPGSNPGGGMPVTVPARDFAGLGSLAEPGWPMTSSPTFESWSRDSRRPVHWSHSQSPSRVSGPDRRTADSGRRFTVVDEMLVGMVSIRTHGLTGRHCPHEAVIEVRLLVCPSPVERQAASVMDGSGNEPSIRYGIGTVRDRASVCDRHSHHGKGFYRRHRRGERTPSR